MKITVTRNDIVTGTPRSAKSCVTWLRQGLEQSPLPEEALTFRRVFDTLTKYQGFTFELEVPGG